MKTKYDMSVKMVNPCCLDKYVSTSSESLGELRYQIEKCVLLLADRLNLQELMLKAAVEITKNGEICESYEQMFDYDFKERRLNYCREEICAPLKGDLKLNAEV